MMRYVVMTELSGWYANGGQCLVCGVKNDVFIPANHTGEYVYAKCSGCRQHNGRCNASYSSGACRCRKPKTSHRIRWEIVEEK